MKSFSGAKMNPKKWTQSWAAQAGFRATAVWQAGHPGWDLWKLIKMLYGSGAIMHTALMAASLAPQGVDVHPHSGIKTTMTSSSDSALRSHLPFTPWNKQSATKSKHNVGSCR